LRSTKQCTMLQGAMLVDQMIGHIFRIENGLIMRFDIRKA